MDVRSSPRHDSIRRPRDGDGTRDGDGARDGADTILRWIRVLHHGTGTVALWSALTDELRLSVAQEYLIAAGRTGDDALAARLAAPGGAEPGARDMVAAQCEMWRTSLSALAPGADIVSAHTFGATMEVVTVAPTVTRARHAAPHRFLVRHGPREIEVAAVGDELPVPGWPPGWWSVPNLPR
ncbi:hypothetical protein [Symbioplanes lichenis]|uniref:hypothetical protein n=1 Tax=Symbioplanes lichenis TaxID=1629072 RepID=UPI002739522B|nr:hypothetical protein [Actinoplanes lichenis]